jgi:murein DD-endopeptidase MepM/ murein hydrolase activator NlpD
MSSFKRVILPGVQRHAAHWFVFVVAVSTGACSADVTRFDFPPFGLTEGNRATGSLPVPPEPVARSGPRFDEGPGMPPRGPAYSANAPQPYAPPPAYKPAYTPPPGYRGAERVASARDYAAPLPPVAEPARERIAMRPADPPPMQRRPEPGAGANGDIIEVQQGDSLYGIAKRYGVSLSALIDINGLANGASVKPGQRLLLPGRSYRPAAIPPAAPRNPPVASNPPAEAPPIHKAGWEGRYTMKLGDSLYGIARRHGISVAELQRVNRIADPRKVRAGTVLAVPGSAAAAEETPPPAAQHPAPPVVQTTPRIINAPREKKTAALDDRTSDARAPASEAGPIKFRWPVRGRIVSAFGKRSDGTHNDGINLAVPLGTDVHAVESGRVAYAGDELKGYGNLILIRHDKGWVSAYAHNDQLLVKRDDVVRRGQVIAKAGKTGTVDQPQLHFELRQGSKPVDPVPHLETN